MDPLAAAAAKGAAGHASGASVKGLKWAVRKWRLLGIVDQEWLYSDDDGAAVLHLGPDEMADVRRFLASDRMRPVLALLASTLLVDHSDDETIATIKTTFGMEAGRWKVMNGSAWNSQSDQVWNSVCDLYYKVLPSLGRDVVIGEFEQFTGFANAGFRTSEDYRHRIIELASDLESLVEASVAAEQVTAAIRSGSLPGIISHSDVDEHPDFAKLYVPRVLHDLQTGRNVLAQDLVSAGQGFRLVMLGNPGAGKSTFVRHLTWELAQSSDGEPAQPAITIKCREYAAQGWTSSIPDYLAHQARADLGVEAAVGDIVNGIRLGKFVVIFDGLDEITSITKRSEFVERLKRFAAAYPVASMLVTSREVGYPRAALDANWFAHVGLREFTNEQVGTYVENWFGLRDRRELVSPFMRESISVADLRSNPLMLSLLCILYRARGAIPRRRRDIYGKCADLLFNLWDSHRQIEQPEELPAYGQRLMQEIARWVYSSKVAQGGLEQQVIEKVISTYLVSVGVTDEQARQRSHEFLEFCAGRAWLLGAFGTNAYGDRIFNFTHRTFYEYFAAEAMSRQGKTVEQLSEQVVTAYVADATSVLPELLVQAYDERVDNGARDVFKQVVATSTEAALILRLMNGSLLPASARSEGFGAILEQWRKSPSRFDDLGFDALFALEPSALSQFQAEFLRVLDPFARNFFARGWSAAVLDGRVHSFPTEVAQMASEVASQLVTEGNFEDNDLLINWLILRGDLDPSAYSLQRLLAARDGKRAIVGVAWLWIRNSLAHPEWESGGIARRVCSLSESGDFPRHVVRLLADALGSRAAIDGPVFANALPLVLSEPVQEEIYLALVALAMATAEDNGRPEWFSPYLVNSPGTVADMDLTRRVALAERDAVSDPEVAKRATDAAQDLPGWAQQWVQGEFDLLRAQPELVEDLDQWVFDKK